MTWHLDVLAPRQRRVLAQIGPLLSRRGFYLAGGTAVALHLGHRRSVDFDWFTPEGLDDPLQFAAELRADGVPFVVDQVAPGTLHGAVRGVRVSLLRFRYRLLRPLRNFPGGIRIASRADLAAMKLSAISRRGAKKDFADIYALAKRAGSLKRMIGWYREKFAVEDLAHLLYSLAYFDDADRRRMPTMLSPVKWLAMKDAIRAWTRKIISS